MATYLIRVRARFEAAHHLYSYGGLPEPNHGHSWQVEVAVASDKLNPEGLAFDFGELKQTLESLAARFQHRDINTVPPFDQRTPSTEHLAQWFYEQVTAGLPQVTLTEVTVWEGPDCSATYRP